MLTATGAWPLLLQCLCATHRCLCVPALSHFIAQMVAAWVGPAVNDWRMPFTVVAAPSLLCSILMLFIVKEPPRGERAVR